MANTPLTKLYEVLQMYEIQDAEKQAEIDRLTAENKELTERVRNFEEQIKVKSEQSQKTRSKDDSIMKMYEAQAIAIEKQMEVDKLKEEMNELKEKMDKMKKEMERLMEEKDFEINKLKKKEDDLMDILKRLGKDQEETFGNSSTKNIEKQKIDTLEERDKEKEKKIEEMKKKNEELEERLKRIELNRVKEKIIGNPVSKQPQRNTILVIGESNNKCRCLILSVDRTKWLETNLKLPCDEPRAVVYNDEELYLIDAPTNGATTNALYKLDRTLKWKRLADMNEERWYIRNSCLVENGYIWVFGGQNSNNRALASVERYDPKENKWALMPEMKHRRHRAAATAWNKCIVISGGCLDFTERINTVECSNPENDSWAELPDMPTAIMDHSLVSYKHKLIIMGGYDGQRLPDVWQLDPYETNPKWRRWPSMKHPSSYFAGIVFDEEIYAIGGCGIRAKNLNRVEIFNGKDWRAGPPLLFPMGDTSVMIIPQHYADRLCNL